MGPITRAAAAVLIFLLLVSAAPVHADVEPARPVRVTLDAATGHGMVLLSAMRVDVDAVGEAGRYARVYVTEEELNKLQRVGFHVTRLPWPEPQMARRARKAAPPDHRGKGGVPTDYHTYETLTSHLTTLAADHPDLVRVMSIGQSVEGRELWMVKISRNPDLDEDEPEFSYISSMHGDEVVGKEMLVGLIDYLTDNYGTDPRVTAIVDTTEIWLMPSMNPDGTARGWRQNARGFDLNRDFPDHLQDPNNTIVGREVETAAVMLWEETVTVNLSANMHGGALVVNYPFDGDPNGFNGLPSPSPDDDLFISVSRTYADNNSRITSTSPFTNGITNGSDWYTVYGGMQDWFYVFNGNYDVTLELGSTKWPPAEELPGYWTENLESMLAYLERVQEGVRGVVTDAVTGDPLAADVVLAGNPIPVYTDPDVGDYHRMLLPGAHSLTVESPGYETFHLNDVVVGTGSALRFDVALVPLPIEIQATETAVIDGLFEPGESATLAVTLENLGILATSVTGTLVPTGWFANVTRADAAFPDIATGDAVLSLPPHFRVALDADVPPGHRPGFAVRWQAGDASGVTEPFFLDVGAPRCASFAASDLPQDVPDLGAVTDALAFDEALVIEDVRVTVDIRHSFIGDLRLLLHSPAGTTVRLHDRRGGGVDNIIGTYPPLATDDPLSSLAGESSAGTWMLEIQDAAPGNTGSLEQFSVEVCGRPVETTTPEMRLSGLGRDGAGVLLEWWGYPGLSSYRVYRTTDPSSMGSFVDVTASDDDPTDTRFLDTGNDAMVFWLVTGVGSNGEGPR